MLFSNSNDVHSRFFDYFTKTGWAQKFLECEMGNSVYSLRILETYYTEVFAIVSDTEASVTEHGDLGIIWLEGNYEYQENNLCHADLKNISDALDTAEELLLTIGIPFVEDYKFHGTNAAKKARKNVCIRLKWEIDKWIKKYKELSRESKEDK